MALLLLMARHLRCRSCQRACNICTVLLAMLLVLLLCRLLHCLSIQLFREAR
jgi:hypothetical protein